VAIPPGTDFSVASTLYTLQPGDTDYEQVSAGAGTTAGFGYWATIANADQASFTPVTLAMGSNAPYHISVPPGSWVTVGDPSGLLAASIQGADVAYSYAPATGYQVATTLQPGQGAMVTSATGAVVTVTPLQPVAQPQTPAAAANASPPVQTTTSPAVTTVPTTASVGPVYANPVFPNPLSAVSPMSVSSWLATPQPPLNPPLPFYSSQPIFGRLLCPSDVVTQTALLLCGALAANGPSAAPVVTPTGGTVVGGSGTLLNFVPPLGCISFTGGPCITLCADGQWSSSVGPGTCSFHGGEA
jgi:hypothetical protein